MLYVTAEVIRQVAILAQPFMPDSACKFLDMLAIPAAERDFSELGGGASPCARNNARPDRTGVPALRRAGSRQGVTMLVDSHCHLDFPDFAPELDAVVARRGGGRRAAW